MKKIHKRTAEIVNIHTFTKILTTLDQNAAAHRQESINFLCIINRNIMTNFHQHRVKY